MSRHRPAAVVILALAIAACNRREPPQQPVTAPPADVAVAGQQPVRTSADPAMAQTRECVNPADGYAVRYPATWHVNTGALLGPCSLFDPEPIEIPEASELPPAIAVMIGIERTPFATVSGEAVGRRDISRKATTVDGRDAVRVQAQSTGEGLHDRGMHSYHYFIDLGAPTMIATTYGVGDLPFERKRRILDAMMETMQFQKR